MSNGHEGARGRTGTVLAAVAVLLAACWAPGCGGRGEVATTEDFARLLDADRACVLVEWTPAPPAAGKDAGEPADPCGRAIDRLLAAAGDGTGNGRAPEDADEVHRAIGRVVGLLAAGRLFEGPVRYGAMIAPPEADDMLLPSAADLLVGRPTREGAQALSHLLDTLAARDPDRVRQVEGAGSRDWEVEFPSFRGRARIRLAGGELRASFGGGSLDGERDRLLAGRPAARPLGDVLPPGPVTGGAGGLRAWLRPATAAEPVAEAVRHALARAGMPAGQGQPGPAMVLGVLRASLPGAARELLASFADVRVRREGARGRLEVKLADQVSPLVELFHERKGRVSADNLRGVPGDAWQAAAFALPPLDRLVETLVGVLAPDAAPLLAGRLDQPLPAVPGVTPRQLLAALGPGLVTWRAPGDPGGGNPPETGFAVEVRDRATVGQIVGTLAAFAGARPAAGDGDVSTWIFPGPGAGAPGRAVVLGSGRLVVARDRERALAVLEGKPGLGGNPHLAAAIERLAGGLPVGSLSYLDGEAAVRAFGALSAGEGGAPAEEDAAVEDLQACLAAFVARAAGAERVVSVGVRTPEGFRAESAPVERGKK